MSDACSDRSCSVRRRGLVPIALRGVVACAMAGMLLGGVGGCTGDGESGDAGSGVAAPSGPLPSYAEVRDRYNARVGRLEKLQCPVTILATTHDADGNAETSQAEGFLVVERPWNLALRVDKAGQTWAYLGANEEKVWSFDLTQDDKVAYVATRDEARQGKLGGLWALDPSVLMDLLGVMPLPEDEGELAAEMAWSPNGRAVRVIRRVGAQRVVMDVSASTSALVAAAVVREDGSVVGRAAYSSDGEVEVRGDRISRPRMAEAIVVDVPEWDQKIRLRLVDAQNPAERLRRQAFDLDALLDAYGIEEVRTPPTKQERGSAPADAAGVDRGGPKGDESRSEAGGDGVTP